MRLERRPGIGRPDWRVFRVGRRRTKTMRPTEAAMIRKLLTDGDPSPVAMVRRASKSRVLLTCEHAGRAVPLRLGKLGVQPADLRKHIAWDIGAWRLARCLSRLMGSTLVGQRYSRLVIDCNRPGYANDLIPTVSDGTRVPGNEGLKPGDVAARMLEI